MENKIAKLLCDWGVCDEDAIEAYFPRVRDRDDISIHKCARSGVIFTSTSDHMDISHYEEKPAFTHWKAVDRKRALVDRFEDDSRRQQQFLSLISNKKWLDVGSGAGGVLDLLGPSAAAFASVEPQKLAADGLKNEGYDVYGDIADVPDNDYDVITLFHVFEHLKDPLGVLQVAYDKLAVGGRIVLEVPHANDFLFAFLDVEEFKQFTFWSEHLVLHNRPSLTAFLHKTGFGNIVINGFQRYNLANHLHWLKEKKPGGHINWSMLSTDQLDTAYASMLDNVDMTDTLIAVAQKLDS